MYLTFWFLIGCQFLLMATAALVPCHVLASNNRDLPPPEYGDVVRVDYCDTVYQRCCVKGCCDKDDTHIMWFCVSLFLGAGVIILSYTCCKRCYQKAESDITVINHGEDENLTSTLGINQNPQICIVPRQIQTSAPVEDGIVPMTPPPSYEAALTMPPAPVASPDDPLLERHNRTPV